MWPGDVGSNTQQIETQGKREEESRGIQKIETPTEN